MKTASSAPKTMALKTRAVTNVAVDAEVAEAEAMPAPDATPEVLFEDIYVRGSEPQFLRGRVPEENFYYSQLKKDGETKPLLA